MNEIFINEVLKQLEGMVDEKQLKTIERTLYRCLKNKEIREKKVVLPKDNNEALDFFIAAKKIEGCSIKSLNYYYTNVIYNELRLRGFSVDVGVINTRENGVRKQLEVDFVCNLGLKR